MRKPVGKQSAARDPEQDVGAALAAVSKSVEEFGTCLAKYGGSPSDRFIYMAVQEENVRETLAKYIANDEFLIGAYCPGGPGIPEEARVIFEFRHLPPRICLLPILVLVVLDAFTGRVLRIVEPYFPGMEATAGWAAAQSFQPGQPQFMDPPQTGASQPALAGQNPIGAR